MKHDRLVTFLVAVWAVVFAQTVRAATLAEFMGGFDWDSLRWAAALALLGGALRTILSLQSRTIVWSLAGEATWDAGKALIAGMLAYLIIEAVRSSGWAVPSEVRFLAVLVAGIFRMDSVYWMRNAGADWLAARRAQLVAEPATKKDAS